MDLDMVEENKADENRSTKWDEAVIKVEDNIVVAEPWSQLVQGEDSYLERDNSAEDKLEAEKTELETRLPNGFQSKENEEAPTGDFFLEEGLNTEGLEETIKVERTGMELDMVQENKDDDSGSSNWDQAVVKVENNIVVAESWPELAPESSCAQEDSSMEDNLEAEETLVRTSVSKDFNMVSSHTCSQGDELIPTSLKILHPENKKNYNCNQLERSGSDKDRCTTDMGTHTEEGPFTCGHCSYRASMKSNLIAHIESHQGDDNIDLRKSYLIRRTHVQSEEGHFPCTCCDHRTSSMGELITHMKIHSEERCFTCSYCVYRTSSSRYLARHLRIHTVEKRFRCEYCDYKAFSQCILVRHMRVHTGEKPFTCKHCNYRASTNSYLTKHMRIHTGEKPFDCNYCDYKATDRSTIVRHMRIHTGEKPFTCDYCDYRTAVKGSLTKHIKTHTKEISL